MQTHSVRLGGINIIAAISSKGEAYFTINNGITNSFTIMNFMVKLIEHLDFLDNNWRNNSIIMLDNARYHKSKLMINLFTRMKIPVMFLGPYHYKMAPVEMFFAFIKNRDLNTLKTRNVKEY
jgi:transposase